MAKRAFVLRKNANAVLLSMILYKMILHNGLVGKFVTETVKISYIVVKKYFLC